MFYLFQKDTAQIFCKSFLPEVPNVNWSKTHTILDTLSISYLNHALPRDKRSVWRLLFSNTLHGDSFSQLTRFIVDKGPSIIVVRDKEGHVFGAYVSQDWNLGPSFYGLLIYLFVFKIYSSNSLLNFSAKSLSILCKVTWYMYMYNY